MSSYLNSADIYISNSNTDGTSVSLLEAMACALPVVVTNLLAVCEWITEGHNGYIVEPENGESFSGKIIMLMRDLNTRMMFSQNNLALAKERADWEKNFTKLEGIYERLSSQK